MKKKLVIANWKMYIESPEAAKKFIATLKRKMPAHQGVDAWVAAPSALIQSLAGKGPVKIGAQSVSAHADGAHTGELSAALLKAAGAQFVIVGHSERRSPPAGGGETNDSVHQQVIRAAEVGLIPVLCIGETERTPEGAHFTFIEEQLASALRGTETVLTKLVIAYEPLWAIGKQAEDAMKPAELQETVIFIRKTLVNVLGRTDGLKVPVLYGGSVEPDNARALIDDGGVSGLLVGRAGADIDSFVEILKKVGRPLKDDRAA